MIQSRGDGVSADIGGQQRHPVHPTVMKYRSTRLDTISCFALSAVQIDKLSIQTQQ